MKKLLCVILTAVLLIGLVPADGLLPLVQRAQAASDLQTQAVPNPPQAESSDPVVDYPSGKRTTSNSQVVYENGVVTIDGTGWSQKQDREFDKMDRLFNELTLSPQNGIQEIKTQSWGNKIHFITLEVSSTKGLMLGLFWSQFYNDGLAYEFLKRDGSKFIIRPAEEFKTQSWTFKNKNGENHVDAYPLYEKCVIQVVLAKGSVKDHVYTEDWITILSDYQRIIYGEVIYPMRNKTSKARADFFNYYGASNVLLQMKSGDAELWMHRNNKNKSHKGDDDIFFAVGQGNRLTLNGYNQGHKLKIHCENTYDLEIKNSMESFGSADVYYSPTMCYLEGGVLDLSGGIFETSSRGVDRHPYKNGIVQVDAYVKGKAASTIVEGHGGTLRAINARMPFHISTLTSRTLWGTWEPAESQGKASGGIFGTFDSVLLEDSTLYAKNGRDAPVTDGEYRDLYHQAFAYRGLSLKDTRVTMTESEVRDCSAWFTGCDVNLQGCTFNMVNKYNSYGEYGERPNCFALKLEKTGGFIERTIVAAEGKWARGLGVYGVKKLTVQNCDIASQKDSAYYSEGVPVKILDTNLLVKDKKNPYLESSNFNSVFSEYREDEHVTVYYLSEDGDHVLGQELVKDLQPQGDYMSPLPMPLATGGKTTKRLKAELGDKTFGDYFAKNLQGIQEFYNYDSWYMAHISCRYEDNVAMPPLKPSKLTPGENWGVLVNDGWKHASSESFSLDRTEKITFWLDNPDALSGDYTRVWLEQKLPDGSWEYLQNRVFYGPDAQYDVPLEKLNNVPVNETLYCAQIPRTAPGVYCLRYGMEHIVSGREYSDPVFITVEPYAQEIPTMYLNTEAGKDWDPAQRAFRLSDGARDVTMIVSSDQIDMLREFNTLYGLEKSQILPVEKPDGWIYTGNLGTNCKLQYVNPPVREPTDVPLGYRLAVHQPRTNVKISSTSEITHPRCYGAGSLDLPEFELPLQYGYRKGDQRIGVGRQMNLLLMPKKSSEPSIYDLGVCDAGKPAVTFHPEYTYDIFEDESGNIKLNGASALNIHADEIRMIGGTIQSIRLESFAQPYDLDSLELVPASSVSLLEGKTLREDLGVKIGSDSQYVENAYTKLTSFTSRIPVEIFKTQEGRDWYLAVQVSEDRAVQTTYRFKLMSVNRAGNFKKLSVNLEGAETVLPLDWSGSDLTIVSGPSKVRVNVNFDGVPMDEDYLEVQWYRQLPANIGSAVPVLRHTVSRGDAYCLTFDKDTVLGVDKGICTFTVPTSLLVKEDIRNQAYTNYEFYAVVKYLRSGQVPSTPADSRYQGTGRCYPVRIDGKPSPNLKAAKYTGEPLNYIPSDILGLPDVYPSKQTDSAGHAGTFENPLDAKGFWEYLLVSRPMGHQNDTYQVDWVVSNVFTDHGTIHHEDTRVVHSQDSTKPEKILEGVRGTGAFCGDTTGTAGGTQKYLMFAYKFLQDKELAIRPGSPRVERITGTDGQEYARSLFAVQPVITWQNRRGSKTVVSERTVYPAIYCYSQIPYATYENAENFHKRMPGEDLMEIRYEWEDSSGGSYYYGPLETAGRTFYANEELFLALRMEVQGGNMLSHADISNIYVDWYSLPFKSSKAGTLLCTNEYKPEVFRSGGPIRELYALNTIGGNTPAYPPTPYIYGVLRAHDSAYNVDYVSRTKTITIPKFVERGGQMYMSGVKVNDRYTAYAADMLSGLPAMGSLTADGIPDELLIQNTDPIRLNFGKSVPDGQHGFIEVSLVRGDSYRTETLLYGPWDCTSSREIDVPALSRWQKTGREYLGQVPMLLKFTYYADTDGSLNTTADRGTEYVRYLPIKVTSANAYPPEMDRSAEPQDYLFYQTTDSTPTHSVYGCHDWISPGKVSFGKHPAAQWDPGTGRRLALCYYMELYDDATDVYSRYYVPVAEMMLTDQGYVPAPDRIITESRNYLYFVNDPVLDPKDKDRQFIYEQGSPWQGAQCAQVRPDGSVLLTAEFFEGLKQMGSQPEIRMAFVAVSNIQPLDETTVTTAAAAGVPFYLNGGIISVGDPEIDPLMPKSDFIGVYGNSGTQSNGHPSATLLLPNDSFDPYVLYTWYAYDTANNTLLPIGDRNSRAVLETENRDGEPVTLAHMPLRGQIPLSMEGEYEVICGFEYRIAENYDGGDKVWSGACCLETDNNQAPTFADAEHQTPIAVYMTDFTSEAYVALRSRGLFGTNIRFVPPTAAAIPNYLAVVQNPSIPSNSQEGVEIRWAWKADTAGIGTITINYTIIDQNGQHMTGGQLTDCGQLVTIPVYNGAVGTYTVTAAANNYYAPSQDAKVQDFSFKYTVVPGQEPWTPVILPIESFDVTQELLQDVSVSADLDYTNADDGSINYLWEYENAGSYSKVSTSQVLTGTALQNAGVNSVGAYHIRLTVTNTSGSKTVSSTELFTINVVENVHYQVAGTVLDEQSHSAVQVRLYGTYYSDDYIRDGRATALDQDAGLDAEPSKPNGDGTYTHSYAFHICDGDYKIGFFLEGCETVIRYVTVDGQNVTVEPVSMLPGGTAISGTVTSYDDGTSPLVTYRLMQEGVEEPVQEVTTTTETEYAIENVMPGDYILQVSRRGHVTREYPVTVGTEPVTLDVKICLLGDVNGDGKLNNKDILTVHKHIASIKRLEDPYQLMCADVNSNGAVNNMDVLGIQKHIANMKKLW